MPELRVNGHDYSFDAPVGQTLAETLREDLGLTGTKIACGEGHCGACTVQLNGVPVLSCITLVHTVGAREVTTIEGLRRPPARRRVRPHRRAPVRLLHARPDRLGGGSRRGRPAPDERADPARDGGEPLPLRHLSAHRGGDLHVARLIRSEKEVEGRYEEVWTLVEEDALDQWPAGPGDVVGRPGGAPRRLREGPRDRALHRRPPASGDVARCAPAQPVRALPREEDRPRRRGGRTRRARRDRAGRGAGRRRRRDTSRGARSAPWRPRRSRRPRRRFG